MWTWTPLVTIALIVQGSYGIRTFLQDQVPWKVENEVLGHSFGKVTHLPVDDLHLEDYVKQMITGPENKKFDPIPTPTPPTPPSTVKPETSADVFNVDGENSILESLLSPLTSSENPLQSLAKDFQPENGINIRRSSPIYRKKLVAIRINKNPKPINSSPFPFLDAAANDGDLGRIIEQAGKMMDALSSSDQKDEGQPISFLKSLNQEKNIETNDENRDMYDVLTRMMKNTPTSSSEEDAPSCGSPVTENEESSARKMIVRINLSPRTQSSSSIDTPKIGGLMLKPLVPRDFFTVKDIFDNMKSRGIVNDNNEEDEHLFRTGPFLNPRIHARFIALAPKILPRNPSLLPPLHFPEEEPQFKLRTGPEDVDLNAVIKSILSPTGSSDQFRDLLKRFQNRDVQTASDLPNFQNDNEDDGEYGPELDALVRSLLPTLGDQMPLDFKGP